MWGALPRHFILDWDSTVLTRYGKQEDAKIGYNPVKRGRPSHHPLLAVVAGTRLCAYYRLRPGDSHTAGDWVEAMEECLEWLGPEHVPYLNRGDIGYGGEEILAWHEREGASRPRYLFKLRMTRGIHRALASVREEEWRGESSVGALQVAERMVRLSGWSCSRRVVFGRRLRGVVSAKESSASWDVVKHEYEAYVTSLDAMRAAGWQVIEIYRGRADTENVFDELKNQWGFGGFCSRDRTVTEMASRLLLLFYNLWNLFMRLMEPRRHVEAFQGRRWFFLIAARLVRSARELKLKVSVSGDWQALLKDGYARVCAWLRGTVPQLGFNCGAAAFAGLPCGTS